MGDFFEIEIGKPYKIRAEDSEKLYNEGWVSIEQLLTALHKNKKWKDVWRDDLVRMVEQSEKNGMRYRMKK